MKTTILIDGNGLLNNSYFSLKSALTKEKLHLSDKAYLKVFLNKLRFYADKAVEYNSDKELDIILILDSPNSWRKEFFTDYKFKRSIFKTKDDEKEHLIFIEKLKNIKKTLKEIMPLPIIACDNCEGDDIIATYVFLSKKKKLDENIIIYSSDKDFVQLQRYPKITQYSFFDGKRLYEEDPELFLTKQIITGDASDCIPNIYSEDTFLRTAMESLTHTRQKSIRNTFLDKEIFNDYYFQKVSELKKLKKRLDPADLPFFNLPENEMLKKNLIRNQKLIDFSKIPKEIFTRITDAFLNVTYPEFEPFRNYCLVNKIFEDDISQANIFKRETLWKI